MMPKPVSSGAGFAFAAKDTLEHLFGSFTVIADRPFQVGDWVEICRGPLMGIQGKYFKRWLPSVSSKDTRWKDWVRKHPDSKILK